MEHYGASFRKFLRMRQHVKVMKRGAWMLQWDEASQQIVERWFVLDRSHAILVIMRGTDDRQSEAMPLSSVVSIDRGETEELFRAGGLSSSTAPAQVPFIAVHSTARSLIIFPQTFREFELWYQGLLFLCELITTPVRDSSPPQPPQPPQPLVLQHAALSRKRPFSDVDSSQAGAGDRRVKARHDGSGADPRETLALYRDFAASLAAPSEGGSAGDLTHEQQRMLDALTAKMDSVSHRIAAQYEQLEAVVAQNDALRRENEALRQANERGAAAFQRASHKLDKALHLLLVKKQTIEQLAAALAMKA